MAGNALRFGDRLTASKLKLIDWPVGRKPVGVFTTIEEVIGKGEEDARFAMAAIEPDEPILSSKITIPGQRAKLSSMLSVGMKAISIRVSDVLGVAGFVFPGDRVDIMLSRGGGRGGGQSYVDVLLQGVKVLAIDQSADDRKDKATVARTVTFEVSTAEAQKLTLAANVGTLSLALRNVSSSDYESIDRVSIKDLGGGELSQTLAQEVAGKQDKEKLENIEKLVKEVGDKLSSRINQVEDSLLDKQNQVVVQKPLPVIIKPVVIKPQYSIVGVTRSGKRSEYRFEADE